MDDVVVENETISAKIKKRLVGGRVKRQTFRYPTKQSIGFLLRRNHLYLSRLLASRISSENITLGVWYFLRALWEEDGITQRELTRRLGAVEPTAVTALEQMERRGLIWRGKDPQDRRRRIVYLTEKGRKLEQDLLPYVQETNQIALSGISSEDVEHLRATLLKIKANFDDHNGVA
jgi:DNA-binding MarR family transcriptional regulator